MLFCTSARSGALLPNNEAWLYNRGGPTSTFAARGYRGLMRRKRSVQASRETQTAAGCSTPYTPACRGAEPAQVLGVRG